MPAQLSDELYGYVADTLDLPRREVADALGVSVDTVGHRPPIHSTFGEDTARTRRTDRVQSHMAGDRSQATVKPTKRAVLILVLQEGELTGSEINDLYRARRDRNDWNKIAFETPRKRAEELEKDGFLSMRLQTSDGNHLPEAVYSITDKGIAAVSA